LSVKRPSTEEEAALYDSVVVPRWSARFAQLILRNVGQGLRAQVLDIGCGTGHPAFSLLDRLDVHGRVIAIDTEAALVDLARRRAMALPQNRIFFKVESAEELKFGDDVFDIAIGNLALGEIEDKPRAFAELRRVLIPDGRVLMTQALEGTFVEIFDMFEEIATERGDARIAARLAQARQRYPSPRAFEAPFRAAGFTEVEVTTEPFRLSFRNAASILMDRTVGFVGLSEWRFIAGFEPGGELLLGEVARRLDVYFGGGPLSLSVVAGLVSATSPA
jgi:ubiquinone/menaquinone biosynthesis C-methylase UbiE